MQGVRGVAQLTSPMSPRPANPIPTGPSRPGTATPRPGGFPPNPAQRPPGSLTTIVDPFGLRTGGRFKSTSRPGPRDTLTIRTQIPGAGEREARLKGSRVPLTGSPTLLNAQKQIPTPGFFGAVKAFVKSIVTKDPIGAAAHLQLRRAYALSGGPRPRRKVRTRISSRSGKMPIPTSQSSSKPRRNTPSCSGRPDHPGSMTACRLPRGDRA